MNSKFREEWELCVVLLLNEMTWNIFDLILYEYSKLRIYVRILIKYIIIIKIFLLYCNICFIFIENSYLLSETTSPINFPISKVEQFFSRERKKNKRNKTNLQIGHEVPWLGWSLFTCPPTRCFPRLPVPFGAAADRFAKSRKTFHHPPSRRAISGVFALW